MRFVTTALALSLVLGGASGVLADSGKSKDKQTPPGLAKKGGVPPGLAKKGGVPPGLAKKFGAQVPKRAYIAFEPNRDDRAWFLIEGRWVLQEGFTVGIRAEVGQVRALPSAPPPVELPLVDVDLHVVLFE